MHFCESLPMQKPKSFLGYEFEMSFFVFRRERQFPKRIKSGTKRKNSERRITTGLRKKLYEYKLSEKFYHFPMLFYATKICFPGSWLDVAQTIRSHSNRAFKKPGSELFLQELWTNENEAGISNRIILAFFLLCRWDQFLSIKLLNGTLIICHFQLNFFPNLSPKNHHNCYVHFDGKQHLFKATL